MKKALDESTIANELRGASAFFSGAREEQSRIDSKKEKAIERSENRSVKRSVDRSEMRTAPVVAQPEESETPRVHTVMDEVQGDVFAPARATERYAFEIYTDQKKQLNRIRYLYEEKRGKKLSASRILREAIEPHLNALEEQLIKP